MASEETDLVHKSMLAAGKHGVVLFKNVKGGFYTPDSVKRVLAACATRDIKQIILATKSIRRVLAGVLCPGASDMVGWRTITITEEMIGKKIAQAVWIEQKTATGRVEPDQKTFLNNAIKAGCCAGVSRSPEDTIKIITESV